MYYLWANLFSLIVSCLLTRSICHECSKHKIHIHLVILISLKHIPYFSLSLFFFLSQFLYRVQPYALYLRSDLLCITFFCMICVSHLCLLMFVSLVKRDKRLLYLSLFTIFVCSVGVISYHFLSMHMYLNANTCSHIFSIHFVNSASAKFILLSCAVLT